MNYQTLMMMLRDAPRYVRTRKRKGGVNRTAEEEASDIIGFFQSKLI